MVKVPLRIPSVIPSFCITVPSGTWFTVWLDIGCGGQGLGGYKSTTPADPKSWTHFCVHTGSYR